MPQKTYKNYPKRVAAILATMQHIHPPPQKKKTQTCKAPAPTRSTAAGAIPWQRLRRDERRLA